MIFGSLKAQQATGNMSVDVLFLFQKIGQAVWPVGWIYQTTRISGTIPDIGFNWFHFVTG